MCLITTQTKAMIAKEDMNVFKLLTNKRSAIFNNFDYEKNTLYKTTIKKTNDFCCFDGPDKEHLNRNNPGWLDGNGVISIGRGFHASLTKERLKQSIEDGTDGKIYKCTIPKGARYYTNGSGLIVSNKIIVH